MEGPRSSPKPRGPRLSALLSELRRRGVVQVAGIYLVAAWVVIQVATSTMPVLLVPDWTVRVIIMTAIPGFPVAVVLARAFEITLEGLRRTRDVEAAGEVAPTRPTGLRSGLVLLASLASATVGWAVWSHWLQPRARARSASSERRREDGRLRRALRGRGSPPGPREA